MSITGKEIVNKLLQGEEVIVKPNHYAGTKIETIDYLKDKMSDEMFQGFLCGNVMKYISRYRFKNGVEDLKKASVYLGWLIDELDKIEE